MLDDDTNTDYIIPHGSVHSLWREYVSRMEADGSNFLGFTQFKDVFDNELPNIKMNPGDSFPRCRYKHKRIRTQPSLLLN